MHETFFSQSINKMHEKIKLIKHKFTTFTTLSPTSNQLGEQSKVPSMCGDPPGSRLPTKETFGLQKYQLYLYANVFKRHIPSRLLHPRTSESECKANTCNCCKENVWKKAHPCLLHLCSSELKCRSPHLHNLQPVADDTCITIFGVPYLPRVYKYTLWSSLQ
jgi:hypothetical protein